jgi:HEAT repeat protein
MRLRPLTLAPFLLLVLGCRPDPAALIPRLRDGAPEERRRAAEALGDSGGAEVVEALCAALADPEWFVRAEAARALGRIGAAEGVECLAAALEHADLHTRLTAIEALAATGREAAEAMLAALPQARGPVRDKLAAGLGRVGDPRATDPLLLLVRRADGAEEGAARGLVALGRPDLLLPFLAEPPGSPRRRAAARGLRAAYDPASLAALERALVGPGGGLDPEVALALAHRHRLDALIATLDGGAADTDRRTAAEALASSPKRRAELALDRAIERRDLAAVAGAHLRLIREGREDNEQLLVAALAASGSETMAVRFWECGNPVLREAGAAWLAAHGRKEVAGRWVAAGIDYVILPGAGGAPREPEVLWGQP